MSDSDSRQRLVAALRVPAAVIRAGRYTSVNPPYAALFGRSVDALFAAPDPFAFVAEEERALVGARHLARARGDLLPTEAVTVVGADGERRKLLLDLQPLGDEEHLILARPTSPEAAALESGTLDAIHQVAMLDATLRLDQLIARVVEIVGRATSSDATAIYLCDEDGDHLVLAGTSDPGPLETTFRRIPIQRTESGQAMIAAAPRAFSVEHLPPPTREHVRAQGFVQLAILPLLVGGRVAGTLNLSRRRDELFTPEQLRAAEMLVAQTALQVERARLHDEARRRVEDLSVVNEVGALLAEHLQLETVFAVAMKHLSRLVSVDHTFLLLLDEPKTGLRIVASDYPLDTKDVVFALDRPSASSAAFLSRKPVVVVRPDDDIRMDLKMAARFGYGSLLSVPLLSRGEPIGVVTLGAATPSRRFDRNEINRAVAVANQLASAIVNARLFEDVQRSLAELSAAQSKLVTRERLAALGELSASVAHEVRNPLGAIFNVLARLKQSQAIPDAERALLAVVGEESERLNQMVSDLLDFARPHSAEKKPTALGPVLAAAIEAATWAHGAPNVVITLKVEPTLDGVPLDARLVHQALVNLIVNALQAMPEGGRIDVRADRAAWDGLPCARVDVTDSGPGISPESVEKVFQPFFTTRAAGTGLGLSVVKRIADAHDGHVSAENGEAGGAKFSIWLPL